VSPARKLAAAAAALAMLVTGCSASATAGQTAGRPPTTLAGYYAQRLDWRPCDNGFECARLLVPFDYARPAGRRFSLPVIKLPASQPSRRVGALVINPGGPGGSGVQYALGARSEFPAALLARFDVVGFDPRGVAGSEPALTCQTGPQLDQYLATEHADGRRAAGDGRHAEQALRGPVRTELGRPAALRGHPERGP
jgi:pimeloyl-ACP methyl ester carboxylesterase